MIHDFLFCMDGQFTECADECWLCLFADEMHVCTTSGRHAENKMHLVPLLL